MKHYANANYAVDNSSLLYLSLIRKDHVNSYRFTMTLKEEICPEVLQMAVDRIYRRFPTVIAGFYPGFFHYLQVPAKEPPQVQPDAGCLITMTQAEIRKCAYRVYYKDKSIIMEAFHALTDGYGAIACLTTLAAEYLRLMHGVHISVSHTLIDLDSALSLDEVVDSYLEYESGKPALIPNRHSYQLPGGTPSSRGIYSSRICVPVNQLLDAGHRHGGSMTALLSTVMADSIMDIQKTHSGKTNLPVRIMVPVDLRRMFPSRTLRNFVLYVLPTMEPQDSTKSFRERLQSFVSQMHKEIEKNHLASIMAYHVKAQHNWLFRHTPRAWKCFFMRLVYHFFGEVNSSITLTNLGNVQLPDEMARFIDDVFVTLTPRRRSPYNCGILSYNGQVSITISRFSPKPELETVFHKNLNAVLQE